MQGVYSLMEINCSERNYQSPKALCHITKSILKHNNLNDMHKIIWFIYTISILKLVQIFVKDNIDVSFYHFLYSRNRSRERK